MVSRLRFVLAQVGRKPGAREQLASLLDVADLPGEGWREADSRTWRTGRQTPDQEWARRASALGSITAWRSFTNGGRWLWVQVTPLATEEDARAALAQAQAQGLKNANAAVRLIEESEVGPPEIPAASEAWARRQRTAGEQGEGTVLMVGFVQGTHLVVLSASGDPEWTWTSVADLLSAQSSRLAN